MDLNGKWSLCGPDKDGKTISLIADVPGCVTTDFINNGIIKGLYYRDNSKDYEWLENNNYTYSRQFTVDKAEPNAFIEFDGLDTYSTVYLNGKEIGKSDNMFISYAFNVDGILKEGVNDITVEFRSPIKEVEGLPPLHGAFTTERMYTRRIQCTYSWDWVARFVTMGIYRDVRLVFRKSNEIDSFYLFTKKITDFSAQLSLDINYRDFCRNGDYVSIEILAPNGERVFAKRKAIIESKTREYIDIRNAELWYPNGYGKQPLYTLRLSTSTSSREYAFGIRELTIIQLPDTQEEINICRALQAHDYIARNDKNEDTSGFTVAVNGIRIFCMGGNWVPCEPFPSEESDEKITRLLTLARDAGVNMLRVWGGGIFEKEHFYSECDRLGILVTQDFLMACGAYPESEPWFIEHLKNEATYAAYKLRNRTCLAWWSGDNENAVGGNDDTFDYPGYKSAQYGIKPVLDVLDPERYFLPSSPYGGNKYCSATKGTTHNTFYCGSFFAKIRDNVDNYIQYFNTYLARFNVEQLAMGMPFTHTLKKFMTDEDIYGDSRYMHEYHTKNNPPFKEVTVYGHAEMFAEKLFGTFTSGKDRILKMQMLHCEWIRMSLELFRRHKWFSSGIIYWMFDDCWPAASGYSLVDYYCNPKPAYYTFKRCASDFVVSIDKKDGKYIVYGSNNALESATSVVRIYVYDFNHGKKGEPETCPFSLEANSAGIIGEFTFEDGLIDENSIVVCEAGGDRTFYVENKFSDLNLKYDDFEIDEHEDFIYVKANSFIPYTVIDVPYLLEDNCFMLLKNETIRLRKVK